MQIMSLVEGEVVGGVNTHQDLRIFETRREVRRARCAHRLKPPKGRRGSHSSAIIEPTRSPMPGSRRTRTDA